MAKKEVGKNVLAEVVKGKLSVEIDLSKDFGKSKSGKTIIIATTQGNVKMNDDKEEEFVIGINVYRKE